MAGVPPASTRITGAPTSTPATKQPGLSTTDGAFDFEKLAPSVAYADVPGVCTGSGILLRQGGRYAVVTSRHVIADAENGVVVTLFTPGSARSTAPKKVVIPATRTRVASVHAEADLAVLDINAAWVASPLSGRRGNVHKPHRRAPARNCVSHRSGNRRQWA